jgi:hypothetical protein
MKVIHSNEIEWRYIQLRPFERMHPSRRRCPKRFILFEVCLKIMTNTLTGPKYEAALKWGLTIVDLSWLERMTRAEPLSLQKPRIEKSSSLEYLEANNPPQIDLAQLMNDDSIRFDDIFPDLPPHNQEPAPINLSDVSESSEETPHLRPKTKIETRTLFSYLRFVICEFDDDDLVALRSLIERDGGEIISLVDAKNEISKIVSAFSIYVVVPHGCGQSFTFPCVTPQVWKSIYVLLHTNY